MNNNLSVLLVDDEPDLSATLKIILEKGGFTVETASSVEVATKMLGVKSFDVVVSDYQMPGKDGLQFLKELRGMGDSTPFIVLTGRGREEVVIQALNLGADRYIQKGGNIEAMYTELSDAIKRSVEGERAKRALLESEERYRSLVERANDGVTIIQDGLVRFTNLRLAEMHGGSVEEIVGTPFTNYIHPDELSKVADRYKRRIAGEKVPPIYETVLRRKDGGKVDVELNAAVITYEGKPADLVYVRDITERRKMEEELVRLSDAVRMSSESIVISDVEAKILDVNEATLKMYGTDDRGDLIGKKSFELIAPEDREKAIADAKEAMEKGYVKDRSYHIIIKNGSKLPVEMTSSIMKGIDGKPIGFMAITKDITERKRAEDQLRCILESSPYAMTVTDLTGKILQCNQAVLNMHGFSAKEEYVGKSAFDFVAPRDRQRAMESLMEAVKHGSLVNVEIALLKPDGHEFPAELSGSIIKDASNNPSHFIGIGRDISERKKMEADLRESEEKYRSIFETAANLILLVNRDGVIVDCNRQINQFLGYTRDELVGQSIAKIYHSDYVAKAQACLKEIFNKGFLYNHQKRMVRKDGAVIDVNINSAARRDNKGEYAQTVCIFDDITECKKTEEQIEHLNLVLRAIRNVNQLITKEKDRESLLKCVCNILIETRGYYNVWVALLDEGGGFVTVAEAGLGKSFSPMVNLLKRGEIPLCGRRALKQPEIIASRDPPSTCLDCPLSAMYKGRGALTVRLEYGGKVYGLLSTSIPTQFIHDKEELYLFKEVAGDIAFALHSIDEEERFKESKEKYQNLVERANDSIVIVQDGLIKYANPRTESFFGFKLGEIVDTSFTKLAHPNSLQMLKERYSRRMAGEKVSPIYEAALKTKDNVRLDVEINAGLIPYQGKTADLIIIRDITTRKRFEEKLWASEERYRTFFQTSRDMVFITSKAGEWLDVNDVGAEILGYRSREELMRAPVYDSYVNAEDREKLLRRIEEKGFVENYPVDMRRRDGSILHTLITTQARKDENGEVVGYQGIIKDITEIRRAQEALQESEERYRGLVDHMYEGLYSLDADNRITFTNPQFSGMLGYRPEELIGKPVFNYFPEEEMERVKEELSKRARGFSSRYELPWITREGGRIPTIISASPIIEGGKYVGSDVVVTNLTERKQLEEEKLQIIDQVARSIAHDIRNPLQAMRLATHILRDAEGDKKQPMLDLIDRNITATDMIVQNLKDLTAATPLKLVEGDVNQLLQRVVSETALPKGVKLTTSYSEIPPTPMDNAQLSRVFGNIIVNSLQAMPKGGELIISTCQNKDFIEVKFKDTGVGIPKENLGKVFHPFYTTKAKGTGLGLANAKNVIEAHRGKITLESEEDKGTTVTVQLPIKPQ